jgi:hypothetical protein
LPTASARIVRIRHSRRIIARWAVAVLLVAVGVLGQTGAGPALASGAESLPVIAGDRLTYPRGNVCTAGAILRDSSSGQQLTQYRRSIRYVLTAGHCGDMGDQVRTGSAVLRAVVGKSSVSDLELVRVDPQRFLTFGCHATTRGPYCLPGSDYRPRGRGRIRMGTPRPSQGSGPSRGGTSSSAPSARTPGSCAPGPCPGTPAACGRREGGWAPPFADRILLRGDSGGPVVSRSRYVYGIISATTASSTIPFSMAYVTLTQFQSEKPSFRLAPAD